MHVTRLAAADLEVTIAGGGPVRVAGRVARQELSVAGPGDYDAPDLDSDEARVRISGDGSATLRVRDWLVATIEGSGNVYYIGDPVIEGHITGSGRIIQIDR